MTDYAGMVRITDAWVEVPLRDGWVAAYRIVNDGGTPVVGEVRVFPDEPDRKNHGQWSGELLGVRAKVPHGGITLRLLREVRLKKYLQQMAAGIERFRKQSILAARDFGWGREKVAAPAKSAPRRGRKGRSDEFYVRVAEEYAKASTVRRSRPIAEIAKSHKVLPSQARDMVRLARKRGLLTSIGPGMRGGQLTGRAESLLRELRNKRQSRRG
jgi:hypothetical protein